jgi:hypothetical protein
MGRVRVSSVSGGVLEYDDVRLGTRVFSRDSGHHQRDGTQGGEGE